MIFRLGVSSFEGCNLFTCAIVNPVIPKNKTAKKIFLINGLSIRNACAVIP